MAVGTVVEQELSVKQIGAMPKGTVLGAVTAPGAQRRYLLRDEADPAAPWFELPAAAALAHHRLTDTDAAHSCGTFFAIVFHPETEMSLAA